MAETKRQSEKSRRKAEQCIQALEAFIEREGRPPTSAEMKNRDDLPYGNTFKRWTGYTPTQYLKQYYPGYKPNDGRSTSPWTREFCLYCYDNYVRQNNRLPSLSEMRTNPSLPNWQIFRRHVEKTPMEYAAQRFPELMEAHLYPRKVWTKERILEALDTFIKQHGRLPSNKEFGAVSNLPCRNNIIYVFELSVKQFWNQYYPELYQLNHWTLDKVEHALDAFVRRMGRLPLAAELRRENGLPCSYTIVRLTGVKSCRDFL